MNKRTILKEIEKNKLKLRGFGVRKIGVFGSFLKGKQSKKSDIDLIAKFNEPNFDNYAEALILLEKLFRRKIDLLTESGLRPELNYIIGEAEYARI